MHFRISASSSLWSRDSRDPVHAGGFRSLLNAGLRRRLGNDAMGSAAPEAGNAQNQAAGPGRQSPGPWRGRRGHCGAARAAGAGASRSWVAGPGLDSGMESELGGGDQGRGNTLAEAAGGPINTSIGYVVLSSAQVPIRPVVVKPRATRLLLLNVALLTIGVFEA